LYGLYDLITQRFIYIHTNPSYLKMIAILFSSRYRLYTCRVDCAKNYTLNIIDNGVATNWGIDFQSYTDPVFTAKFDYFTHIHEVEKLIELGPLPPDEIILKDVPYIQYIDVLWSELENFVSHPYDGYNNDIDSVYRDILQMPFKHPRTKFISEHILSIIYEEYDFEIAKEKIKNAFNSYQV